MQFTLWLQRGCGYGLTERKLCCRWEDKAQKHLRCLLNPPFFFLINCLLSQCFFLWRSAQHRVPMSWETNILGSAMNNCVLLQELLIKKSQQKRRTSPSNFKVRFFVLTKSKLAYYEHRHGVRHRFLSQSTGSKDELCLMEGRMLMEGRVIFVKFC